MFTLRVWLFVDAYTCIGFLLILLALSMLSCLSIHKPNYLTAYTVITTIFGTFRIIWLIIGSVMFWGYLHPKGLCTSGFDSYMWALLMIGFLGIILYYFLGYTYPRIKPLPIKVSATFNNTKTQETNIELRNNQKRDVSPNGTRT